MVARTGPVSHCLVSGLVAVTVPCFAAKYVLAASLAVFVVIGIFI